MSFSLMKQLRSLRKLAKYHFMKGFNHMQTVVESILNLNVISKETLVLLVYLVAHMVILVINLVTSLKSYKRSKTQNVSSESSLQQFVPFLETTIMNLLEAFKTVRTNQDLQATQLPSSQKLEISQELTKIQEILVKLKEVNDNEQKHE